MYAEAALDPSEHSFHGLIAAGGNKNKNERKAHAEGAAERPHTVRF